MVAVSLFQRVVVTVFGVFFLVAAIPAWFDKSPYLSETRIGGRLIESKVTTSRWTPRSIAVASFLGGCLMLLSVYRRRAAVVLGWVVVVCLLLGVGLWVVSFGVRIWRNPEWFLAARALRPKDEETELGVEADPSVEGLEHGAGGWVVRQLLLHMPPRVSAVCLIALGLGAWALLGVGLANEFG
jgi:hypothetical protein